MKKAMLTTVLALVAGATGSANAQLAMVGSDTLEFIMQDLIPACEGLGYVGADGGGLEINYVGGGSGTAEDAMERDSGERTGATPRQQIGPMSRALDAAACVQGTIVGTTPNLSGGVYPPVGAGISKQIIIGRDDILVLGDLASFSDDTGAGLSGDGTPDNWGANMRLLYWGLVDANYNVTTQPSAPVTGAAVDCSAAGPRGTLAASLNLYHIYRRDDASGTTADHARLLKVATTQPYCNNPGVSAPNSADSLNDDGDKDPIRIPCTNGEDVCSCDGSLGLLLPILVPPVGPDVPANVLYPTAACTGGQNLVFNQTDSTGTAVVQNVMNGDQADGTALVSPLPASARCSSGAGRLLAGCVHWTNGVGAANCIWPNVDQTFGLTLGPALRTIAGTACPNADGGAGSNDIRAANLDVRVADGRILSAAAAGNTTQVDWEGRGLYRIHMTTGTSGTMGTPVCQELDATVQIGCLVARDIAAGKHSAGFAGLQAAESAGVNNVLNVHGIASIKAIPTGIVGEVGDPCTTAANCAAGYGMVCTAGTCQPGDYPLARKLYVNVLRGTGAGAVVDNLYGGGDEAALLECILDEIDGAVDTAVTGNGFLARLSTDPVEAPVCPDTTP